MQMELALAPPEKREKRSEEESTPKFSSWDLMLGRGMDTDAGIAPSPYLAENLSVVCGAVACISETVAVCPANVYWKSGDGVRTVDPSHPVARLFGRAPNDLQTPNDFVEMLTAHCLLRGNAFAEIVRDGRGAPVELLPMHPDHVAVMRIPGTRTVVYDYSDPFLNRTRRLLSDEVLHLKDRSDDGIVGVSRLSRARETFGTAIATERFAASTYRNGAALGGVLTHPDAIGDEASENIRKSFAKIHAGSDNAGKFAVLEEGLKWQAVSVSPADAETLGSRRFSVESLARVFRIPPPILGDLQSGNYSAFSELARWFHQQTIVPWLTRWEKAIERSLLSEEGRRTHEVELDADLLLRGDMLSRFQAFRIGREVGLYSANDLRRFEKMNPRTDEDGDTFLSPLNMQPEQKGKPKE